MIKDHHVGLVRHGGFEVNLHSAELYSAYRIKK